MIGMALFQGLLDREGRVLDKANRLAKSGFAALEVDAHGRATIAFVKALEILGAQEPRARIEDFQEAYATIGSGLLRVGRIESAQAAATHALTGNGGDLRALGLQGDIWLAQEHASDALGYYDAGLRIDPKAKDFWERKGDAHVALEQRPEAIRAYMQVVNLDPDDVEGYRRVLSLVPDDAELWVRTGEAHRRRNELDEAQTAFDRALRINSDSKEALEGKALTYLAAGEPQRAIRCLDRVIQLDPYDPDAWRLRGDVLGASNQNEEALRSYDEALRQRDGDAAAWTSRAELLRKTGRSIDAVSAYDRAIGLTPKTLAPRAGRLQAPGSLKEKARALLAPGRGANAYAAFGAPRGAPPDALDALRAQRDPPRHRKNAKVLRGPCGALLQKNPADAGTWTARGEAHQTLG